MIYLWTIFIICMFTFRPRAFCRLIKMHIAPSGKIACLGIDRRAEGQFRSGGTRGKRNILYIIPQVGIIFSYKFAWLYLALTNRPPLPLSSLSFPFPRLCRPLRLTSREKLPENIWIASYIMTQSYFYPRNMLNVISPAAEEFPPFVAEPEPSPEAIQDAYVERKDK
jgi:hypothetical protein